MVDCGSKIIKILLGVFNLLWLLLGGGVIYIGYRLVKWDKEFDGAVDLAKINFTSISIVILGIGIVIALISFLGFFGACCENSFMLQAYGFLMVLMIGAQIYALVVSIKNNGNIQTDITKGIKDAIKQINKDHKTAFILETLQYNLKCCGATGRGDYTNTTDTQLPGSCCGIKPVHEDKENEKCGNKTPYTEGCLEKLHFDQIQTLFKGTIGV
ncbi:PREDICTED: CD63 antigen-like, partial [Rhagoletis zephyria]|uniref:CD63 antigen-like n=1 Tax=Rhagoletis zephyria TaxID=28612 RepID=UPI00081137DE